MPSVTESLAERGMGWSAMSPAEAAEASRVCSTCADTAGRAMQAMAAYFYIASLRMNGTAVASVTDAEAASAVPRLRGSGSIKADAYRKQVKPLLVAWGLVSCTRPEQTGNGRRPTLYGFPMLERLLGSIEHTGQGTDDLPDGWADL